MTRTRRIAQPSALLLRRLVASIAALLVTLPLITGTAWADSPVIVVTGGVTTSDAGSFQVTLSLKTESGCGGELEYGAFGVDAVGQSGGVFPANLTFCVHYEDTQTERDAFSVQIRIGSFELTPVPVFEGSETAHFQIPNRYLSLTTVGEITGGATGPGVGQISHEPADESLSFAANSSLRIAAVEAGGGFLSATQEITVTLAIPAGIHPGRYLSEITIETLPLL